MTILDKIVEHKRREIANLSPRQISVDVLQKAMESRGDKRDFIAALRNKSKDTVALIAEVKRASPSAGVICFDFNPARIAAEYHCAGAACISVLTDEGFFRGSLNDLKTVRNTVPLPLLRKDFIIDERQLLESIEWGADAILLIAAILEPDILYRLHRLATAAGLAVLVEVHDELDLERAIACGAKLIGINNRNLRTFTVDIATTERLAPALRALCKKDTVTIVSESGIKTREDVKRVHRAGADAVLVGETLVRANAIQQKVAELLGVNPSSRVGRLSSGGSGQ